MNEKQKGLFTKVALYIVSIIGGILVGEELLTGEALSSIQSITGIVLAGGGLSANMIIYTLATIIPANMAKKLVDKVGAENVNKVFETVDEVKAELTELKSIVVDLLTQMKNEAEARIILGAYEELTEEQRKRLNL